MCSAGGGESLEQDTRIGNPHSGRKSTTTCTSKDYHFQILQKARGAAAEHKTRTIHTRHYEIHTVESQRRTSRFRRIRAAAGRQ